jgi:type VI secretion system protein ImpI
MDRRAFVPSRRGPPPPDSMSDFVSLPSARPPPAPDAAPWDSVAGYAPPPSSRDLPPAGGGNWQPRRDEAPVRGGQDSARLLAAIARAAGLPPQAFETRPPEEVAAEIGQVLRVATEQLTDLLHGRAQVKLMTKVPNRTMISAQNNNAMKFIKDATDALEIMFGKNGASYMGAAASFRDGFDDIRTHEVATYAAMQSALARIMDDLSPESIEDGVGGGAFGSKKAKAWDAYVARWEAKTAPYENGALDLFLTYFAEAYEKSSSR